jgi:hypothetical protein
MSDQEELPSTHRSRAGASLPRGGRPGWDGDASVYFLAAAACGFSSRRAPPAGAWPLSI